MILPKSVIPERYAGRYVNEKCIFKAIFIERQNQKTSKLEYVIDIEYIGKDRHEYIYFKTSKEARKFIKQIEESNKYFYPPN